jgi:imidazolonepropionase-like amidohydrolase
VRDGANRGRPRVRTSRVTEWSIPGLVDAHVHLTMDFGARTGLERGSDELVRANAEAQLASGVVAVRDAGRIPPGARLDAAPAGLLVISCGAVLAPPGRFFPGGLHVDAPPAELVAIALGQLEQGATWVKLIADFPGEDLNFFAPRVSYERDVVERVCRAVHAAGGRVAAHTSGAHAGELVRAGVDSIEHGPGLDAVVVREMAARGTIWVPTLATVAGVCDAVVAAGAPPAPLARQVLARYAETIPLAVDLGVPVLAGTDESPHGTLHRELEQLVRFGLDPGQAIDAATTVAHAALEIRDDGRRIVLASDPRRDLAALREAGPAVALV